MMCFFKMGRLTSYDMDCDIIADAKCGPASVPIERYVSYSEVNEKYVTFKYLEILGGEEEKRARKKILPTKNKMYIQNLHQTYI